ncbi:MAG: zf-HC2 domain-containing protein [Gemmatimonadales bacterium]
MADLERTVAGLRCREVLADLSNYLDGELPAERAARIEAHVAGCDWCERFGGRFGAVVGEVRRTLADPAPLPSAAADRLAERLGRELG